MISGSERCVGRLDVRLDLVPSVDVERRDKLSEAPLASCVRNRYDPPVDDDRDSALTDCLLSAGACVWANAAS